MQVHILSSFDRDVKSLHEVKIKMSLQEVILHLIQVEKLQEISKIKKIV